MQPKVEEYLASVNAKCGKAQTATKEEILKSAGLIEREYGPADSYDGRYNNYDSTAKAWYRDVPIQVTDEEYEAVRASYERLKEAEGPKESNGIATMLKVIAVLTYIGGFILGFVMGNKTGKIISYYPTEREFNFTTALICWAAAWVSGSLVLGFGEIISLLQSIKIKKN